MIHYQPELLTDEQKKGGIVIDAAIPTPDIKPGKAAKLFYDPAAKTLYHQYFDVPLTTEEELAQLKAQLKITQDALDALLLG